MNIEAVMKKALISPTETTMSYDGQPLGSRVAMVSDAAFNIAQLLFWVDCDDSIEPDQFYWDGVEFIAVPIKPVPVQTPPTIVE